MHPLVSRRILGLKGSGFEKTTYDVVIDLITSTLISIKKECGPTAVIDYVGSGYGGLKGRIQSIFFNAFGGATRPEGSLCWGAGIAAQKYDFGGVKGHAPDDIFNSKMVIVWGRNPKTTNLHLYTRLKKAQKKGIKIVVIDPVQTDTARSFNSYIRINPGTDSALALAMTKVIIENNLHDKDFIKNHVIGFKRFEKSLSPFTVKRAEQITGILSNDIEKLALAYANAQPSSIYLGLGMQRYENGGNTIRSIDALAAIAGKIGMPGGGINYAAKSIVPFISHVEKQSLSMIRQQRRFSIGRLAEFIEKAPDPPVKAIFVAGANPLNQGPDINKAVQAFRSIEFKVVFEHFMTDTARYADIILPAASVFEQEDIFATSMYSPVLNYSNQAVETADSILPEYEFYLKLARKLGIMELNFQSSRLFLQTSVAPLLEELEIDFDQLKTSYPVVKGNEIAWQDKSFNTPSGKIEIYSEKALKDGQSALPVFTPPLECESEFPLRLLTCHAVESMHSQAFAFLSEIPTAFVNEKTASGLKLGTDDKIVVSSSTGNLDAQLKIDNTICDNSVFIPQGYWHKSGAVNMLTQVRISDMGEQVAYYDSFCKIMSVSR